MRTRFVFPLLSLVPLSLIAGPALADDVYLVNGRKFEGVVTETTDTQIRITMQGGTLSLPLDHVLQVDKGESSLQEYLRRKEALKKSGSAREWLELARWAQEKELQQAGREAALAAAGLDPRLPGLVPVLRGYGYVFDEQSDRWIPYAESMRRKGFVLSGGQWISREEHAAKVSAWEAEEARRRAARLEAARAAREERLALLAEIALVRDLVRREQEPPPATGVPFYPYAYVGPPVYVTPGYPPQQPEPRPRPGHGHGRHQTPNPPQGTRVPGSLIPGTVPGLH